MNLKLKFAAALVCILLSAILAWGQGSASGDLHVIVKDPRGSVVTNATVTAREQAKGFMRSTTQNADGEYRLVSLPPVARTPAGGRGPQTAASPTRRPSPRRR